MQNKYNTDIDRKLAIYYHPLFQQILTAISSLFTADKQLSLGLLEFLQFNLKLQKSLLPSFQIENAVISGLNDWVKEVAECLSFEGMVSTANCVQVTSQNISQLIAEEIKSSKVQLVYAEHEYQHFLKQFYSHDAFKLLGVKINNEVFCKFLFDLCSTWCEFLDVEIFVYFLLTLFLQITEGETLKSSKFKPTKLIKNVEYDFFEDFEQLKEEYSKHKKKQLRYYRAWCEWNYLRMNQIGQKVILDLHDSFTNDIRIKSISEIFEKAIEAINLEITNQSKDQIKTQNQTINQTKPKQFLILKKLEVKKQKVPEQLQYFNKEPQIEVDQDQNEFQIEIDEKGNMYLKRIVKIPILGTKITPLPHSDKLQMQKQWLFKKKEEYRAKSNLYRMDMFLATNVHNVKTGPYYYQKNQLIKEIDNFNNTKKNISQIERQKEKEKNLIIHAKKQKQETVKIQTVKPLEHPKQLKDINKPRSVSENQYIHKVIAPPFLTNKDNNLSYATKINDLYGSKVGEQKRNLQYNFPKIFINDVKEKAKGTHIIGKFLIDRKKIKQKLNDTSINTRDTTILQSNISLLQQRKLEKLKQESKHIWNRYISEDQMKHLTDYNEFYEKLWKLKKIFSNQFKSDYVKMIKLDIEYQDTRHEMGGVITKEDKQNFRKRIQKMIERNEKRQNRRKRRKRKAVASSTINKNRQNKTLKFKTREQRELYNQVFINYHREQIKIIKQK